MSVSHTEPIFVWLCLTNKLPNFEPMLHLPELGAALENSLRIFFSNTFFSLYNVVDMVCCMNIHHERF